MIEKMGGSLFFKKNKIKREVRPFDPKRIYEAIQYNEDYTKVPHYCSNCGLTFFISQKEAQKLFLEFGEGVTFPAYQVGMYIENNSCPNVSCSGFRGKKPILKKYITR